jgi:hypothetical protein
MLTLFFAFELSNMNKNAEAYLGKITCVLGRNETTHC